MAIIQSRGFKISPKLEILDEIRIFWKKYLHYLTSCQYLARNLPQEPLPCEAGDGGEGGGGPAHQDVREGHVAHQEVRASSQIWGSEFIGD